MFSGISDAPVDTGDSLVSGADSATAREKTLGALLEQDHILFKVLVCVMEDGLHECRRVCRRWRDVCGKLPVKLGGSHPDKLDKLVDLFPNATSLSLGSPDDNNNIVGRQAIQHLSRLKHLQNLDLSIESTTADVISLVTLLPSTDVLRSFEVFVDQKDKFNDVVHVLRIVTNLETLILYASGFVQTDLEPVTELRGLGCLITEFSLIVNSSGELLFPSLTKLTRLELFNNIHEHELNTSDILKVCKLRKRVSYFKTSVVLVYPSLCANTAVAYGRFSR